MENNPFDSVMQTSYHTLYPLVFTDIQNIKEIYNELESEINEEIKNKKLAPELEARYKLIDKLINRENRTQVLELASGFTPRGINSNKKYIEVDLPKILNRKKEICAKISNNKNLHLISGNVLEKSCFEQIKKLLDKKELIVINQGLMRYLNFNEKTILSKDIFNLLKEYGGVWITCDLTPMKFIINQDKNLDNYNNILTKITKRNDASYRFKSKEDAEEFMKEIGFQIEWHEFTEVKNILVSPKTLGISDNQTEVLLRDAYVSVLRINK